MARFVLHGLAVETSTDLPEDPAALLLARLAPAPPGPADVVVTSRAARAPGAGADRGGAWTGDEHLEIQAGPERVRLRAPGAYGEISRDGRVDVEIDPAAAPGGIEGAAHGLVLVALLAALRPRGLFHLHAACVVAPDGRSVLVPGESGAGKSTLASALAAAGFGYLGDDVVLLAVRRGGPRLLALPREFHLAALSARAIPGAAARLDERRSLGGKHLVDPRALFPGREHADAAAPSAVLFPAVARGVPVTRVAPLTPVEALGRLVECSALVAARGLAGTGDHLAALAAVADGARAFSVALGADLLADAASAARRVAAHVLVTRGE